MDYRIFFEGHGIKTNRSKYFQEHAVRDMLGLSCSEISNAVQEGKLFVGRTKRNMFMYTRTSVMEYMKKYGFKRTDITKLSPDDYVTVLALMRLTGKSRLAIEKAYASRKLPPLVKRTERGVKWFWRVGDLQKCAFITQDCASKSAEPQQRTLLNPALEDQRNLYAQIKLSGGVIALAGRKEIKLYNVKQSLANQVDAQLMFEVLREKQAVLVLWEYFDRVLEEAEAPKELTLTF